MYEYAGICVFAHVHTCTYPLGTAEKNNNRNNDCECPWGGKSISFFYIYFLNYPGKIKDYLARIAYFMLFPKEVGSIVTHGIYIAFIWLDFFLHVSAI